MYISPRIYGPTYDIEVSSYRLIMHILKLCKIDLDDPRVELFNTQTLFNNYAYAFMDNRHNHKLMYISQLISTTFKDTDLLYIVRHRGIQGDRYKVSYNMCYYLIYNIMERANRRNIDRNMILRLLKNEKMPVSKFLGCIYGV